MKKKLLLVFIFVIDILCVLSPFFWVSFNYVYFSPFIKEYTKSECSLFSSSDLYISYSDFTDSKYNHRELAMYVKISEKTYIGFGCQSEANRLENIYKYTRCKDDSCESYQIIQPPGLCEDWSETLPFGEDDTIDCWYALTNNMNRSIDEISIYELYPHASKPYIEIIFQETPYFDTDFYVLFQNLLFVICSLFAGLNICILFPLLSQCKAYYCICILLVKCFKKYICNSRYNSQIQVEDRVLLFRHAVAKSPLIKIKARNIERICSYMSK